MAEPGPRLGAVVLAAGSSRRMGALNKLLEPVRGEPMIGLCLRTLRDSGIQTIVVVTGHMRAEIENAVAPERTVFNPRHAEGMGTSLAKGVEALPDDLDGFLVVLADMPWVTRETVRSLAAEFARSGPRTICIPTCGEARGNPVLFDVSYRSALAGSQGDVGARGLIADNAKCVREVPVDDDGVLRDIDTPDHLAANRTQEGLS